MQKIHPALAARQELFDRLWAPERRTLLRLARELKRNTGTKSLVADLMQDTAVACWAAFESFDLDRPFGPWACRVMVRRAIDDFRKATRRPVCVGEDGKLGGWALHEQGSVDGPMSLSQIPAPVPPETLEADMDLYTKAIAEIEKLPEEWRDTIELVWGCGMLPMEAAMVLQAKEYCRQEEEPGYEAKEIKSQWVRSVVYRARQVLLEVCRPEIERSFGTARPVLSTGHRSSLPMGGKRKISETGRLELAA